MIDMKGITAEKIQSMEDSGQIRERIEKKTEELVLDSIDRALADWNFRRQISDKLTAEVSDVLSKVDFTTYNGMIAEKVQEIIGGTLRADIANKVQAGFESLFVEKHDDIKLSEIIAKYRDYLSYLDDSDKEELNNQFYFSTYEPTYEWGTNSLRITLAKREDIEDDRYEFSIRRSKDRETGKISWVRVAGCITSERLRVGWISSFEALLLNLYYNGTPITLDVTDEDEIDISLGLEE